MAAESSPQSICLADAVEVAKVAVAAGRAVGGGRVGGDAREDELLLGVPGWKARRRGRGRAAVGPQRGAWCCSSGNSTVGVGTAYSRGRPMWSSSPCAQPAAQTGRRVSRGRTVRRPRLRDPPTSRPSGSSGAAAWPRRPALGASDSCCSFLCDSAAASAARSSRPDLKDFPEPEPRAWRRASICGVHSRADEELCETQVGATRWATSPPVGPVGRRADHWRAGWWSARTKRLIFAQLAATGGRPTRRSCSSSSLAAFLRLRRRMANLRISVAPIGADRRGFARRVHRGAPLRRGRPLASARTADSWRRAPTAARRWSARIPTST